MATKTLGIKFSVAGVGEAKEALSNLRSGINGALSSNKRAVTEYQKDIKRGWKEWKTENFGSTSQKQNLVIRQEKREFRERSTYKQLTQNNRALVLEFRLAYKDFFTKLEEILDDKQNPSLFEKTLDFVGKPIGFAVDAILFPFQSAMAGMFERMGEVQVEDFAEGFKNKLQKSIGLSFEEVGADVGDIFGQGFYRAYESALKHTKAAILSDSKDKSPQRDAFITDLKNIMAGSAIKAAAIPVNAHKRIQMNKKAIPLAKQEAGRLLIDKTITPEEEASINSNKSITFLTGGVTMDNEGGNTEFVDRLMNNGFLQNTHVVPIKNPWSNTTVDPEYKQIFFKILRSIMSDPSAKSAFNNYINEQKGTDTEKLLNNEGLDLSDAGIDKFLGLLEKDNIPVIKLLETAYQGYNSDDIAIAAEAMFYREKFPDKPIRIVGTSGGGLNAAGTTELLSRMGYEDVKGSAISTPMTGLEFTGNSSDFLVTLGDKDFLYQGIYEGILKDVLPPPDYMQVLKGGGKGHSLPNYIGNKEFQGRFAEHNKGSIDVQKDFGRAESLYVARLGQYPEKENLLRTLKSSLGEETDAGFTFDSGDQLKSLAKDLGGGARFLRNPELKADALKLVDFVNTLAEELEVIAVAGDKIKPVKSLAKAVGIFPEAEQLLEKYGGDAPDEKTTQSIKQEVDSNKVFIDFKSKIKSESGNIENTLKSLNNQKVEGYSFYDPEEYQTRADEHLGGLIDFLREDTLKDATPQQKGKSAKYLDYLEKLRSEIIKKGRDNDYIPSDDFTDAGKDLFNVAGSIKVPEKTVNQRLTEIKNRPVDVEAVEPVELNTQQLTSAFGDYLQEVIRKGTEYGTKVLRDNARQIEGSSFNEGEITRQFGELNEEFKKATKEYRNAVAEGNSKLATELAENLLFQSASLKRIYGQLVEQIQDPDTARSLRGFTGYLSAVQTEVTAGQPNLRGRVATGLPAQIASSPALEERVRQIDFGADIRDGVEKIINRTTGEEIGYQFVLGINQGGENAADINSPSRVWQWIGEMIRAGFEGGVAGITDILTTSFESASSAASEAVGGIAESVSNLAGELDNSAGLLDGVFQTSGVDEGVNDFFGSLVETASSFFDDLFERFPILGRIGEAIAEIGGELLQVVGLASFGSALVGFSAEALEVAKQMETLERSIVGVSSSASEGANNIKFIRAEAKRLSIDLVTAEESYKRILGATRNTALEGLQTEQLFTTLATTAKNRGLTTDATNRLFLGFEQVIAKNEFKSEEVRGQLAEVLGDIQNLLASSVGVPLSQLGDLMESGNLKAPEVLPKLKATLDAQNAALGDGADTAQAAQTRLNNAILEFQAAVGKQLQPVQKMGLNNLSSTLEVLQKHISSVIKLIAGLLITVLTNLVLKLLAAKFATAALGDIIYRLGFAIGAIMPKLALFLKRFILITAAIEVWSNVIKLAQHPLPEMQDRVEASAKALDALRKAFDDAGDAAQNFGRNQPKQLQLNEGLKVPKWLQGLAGGERLNFDNLFRNRWNNIIDRMDNYNQIVSGGTAPKLKGRIDSQAERKQDTFVEEAGKLVQDSDRILKYGTKAKSVLEDVAKIDEQTRNLQNKRNDIQSGDVEGLKKAQQVESQVLKQRDELTKKSAQYAESVQGQIQRIEASLSDLDELDKTGGNEKEIAQRAATRKSLEDKLRLLNDEKKAIDDINSRIPKFLSAVSRLLRNSDERVQGFIGNQENSAVGNRTEAIKDALANGLSDADLEITLDNLSATDLEDRINFINQEIKGLEDKLGNEYLQEGVRGLERSAASQGLELTNPTLERMVEEGDRSTNEIEAAKVLLALDEYRGIVAQNESQFVDLIKTNRAKLIDFNKTITDYFSRITQQIQEAILESKRLMSQIFYTDIKNRLRSAISPGSNSFVNGIVDNIQSVLDEAQQLAEKAFGDSAAQLSLEMEIRDLTVEVDEFVRQLGTAGDALLEFVTRLAGGNRLPLPGAGSEVKNTAESKPFTPYPLPVTQKEVDPVANYITNVLRQPAGVDTGVEQIVGGYFSNRSAQSIVSAPDVIPADPAMAAGQLNNELVERKRFNLGLQEYSTKQAGEAYQVQVDNTIETNRRQIEQALKEMERSSIELEGKFADLSSQYGYSSEAVELQKALFTVKTTFLDTNADLDTKIQTIVDGINTINNLSEKLPADIARLRSLGTPEASLSADLEQSSLSNLQNALPTLEANLTKIEQYKANSGTVQKQATEFTEKQSALKSKIEALNKDNNLLGVKSNIAATRGTIEQQKQLNLEQEMYRWKLRVAEIELNTKPGLERDELIKYETRLGWANQQNIISGSQLDQFDLDKRGIDYDAGIGDKNAGFLSRYGFNLQADKLRKDSAIASENNRFQKELFQIQNDFAIGPDKIAEFTQKAKELNQVNLKGIDQQFKSLRTTVEDFGISAVQGFFTQFTTNFFDGSGARSNALLEERLRYAEELNQLEKQYQDEPGQLAHLQNRAKLLNEQKLDKINGEFNIFKRVIDLAGQALLEFTKQLVAMVAQQAAAKFITSILGSALGGTGGSATGGAFVADEGITVGNYARGGDIKSRKVSDRLTNYLRQNAPGVKAAWRTEGEGAQLGVFHTGEELLSRKTGEARRYQALKARYGINPLAKILKSRGAPLQGAYPIDLLNYSEGGTIGNVENNVLSGLSFGKTRIDLSGIQGVRGQRSEVRKTVNLTQQIFTPNQDSFKMNGDQRNQDLIESLKRGF